MSDFISAVILLLLAIGGVVVRKTYYALPVNELKRRAEKHDELASRLYPAVAYGLSLRSLLWIFIGLTSAGGFVLLARVAPVWFSLVTVVVLLWISFSWLPASKVSGFGTRLTIKVTPAILWLLNYLHPALSRTSEVVERRYSAPWHTGIYERDDLVDLLERQQWQNDSRLTDEELEIVKRALSFSDHKVSHVMTSRKQIKTVLARDTIGPVLVDELHKSKQTYALVRETPKGDFVGSLAFGRLDVQAGGQVSNVMDHTVYYLHENDALSDALHAFFVTNHPVFVVVNSFEEYVGIISIDNILRQLLGHLPGDSFDQYADIAAVAARHPKHEEAEKSGEPGQTPVKTDEEVVE